MKGGYTSVFNGPPATTKRPWRGFALAVFVLVLCSLLAPLAFLLGLYNRFPSGYLSDDRLTPESGLGVYTHLRSHNLFKGDQSRIDNLMKKFGPSFKKEIAEKIKIQNGRKISSKSSSKPKKRIKPEPLASILSAFETIQETETETNEDTTKLYSNKPCEFEFGSYCLWSIQHKEKMKDHLIRRFKDQLFLARSFYPTIAKLKGNEKLAKEVKHGIQDHEKLLSEAISDADLPLHSRKSMMERMERTITKAKSCDVDCRNFERKLRQLVDLTESETHFHMRQSAFLYHLGVQTVPKTHHCLVLRLTVEYFRNGPRTDSREESVLEGGTVNLRNFVVFSKNLLAVSVTINSAVTNFKESENMSFHILTDNENFYAMKHFFARNTYKNACVNVLNYEQLELNYKNALGRNLSPSEEFRIMTRQTTGYVSVFGHSNFLLSEIFPNLERVVLLEDDLVVQNDLSSLFKIDLEGKVIGAVNFCGVKLAQIKEYLNGFNYVDNDNDNDNDMCFWLSGLNVIDLTKWREKEINSTYLDLLQKFTKEKEMNEKMWREISLALSMLVFKDEIFPLESSWVQSGLGHNYAIANAAIQNATALHYNGNMKPWLDMGIPKYKHYWRKYVIRTEPYMEECNVNH